jgi:hypothetical protein
VRALCDGTLRFIGRRSAGAASWVRVEIGAQALAELGWTEPSFFGDDSIFGRVSARKSKYLLFAAKAYAQGAGTYGLGRSFESGVKS